MVLALADHSCGHRPSTVDALKVACSRPVASWLTDGSLVDELLQRYWEVDPGHACDWSASVGDDHLVAALCSLHPSLQVPSQLGDADFGHRSPSCTSVPA
jgi:hypothetical protein